MVVPVPALVSAPVPLIAFATVSALLRLNVSAALSTTAPVPNWPVVPPFPTCNVPALIVVVPGVGIGARERRRAGPDLCHRAGPADDAPHRERIAAVEGQGRVVDHRARPQLPGRAAVPDLQRPATDRRRPGVGIGAGESRRAGTRSA